MLNQSQLETYQDKGHLTINGFYPLETVSKVISEINLWAKQTRANLSDEDQRWYLEQDVPVGVTLACLEEHLADPIHKLLQHPCFDQLVPETSIQLTSQTGRALQVGLHRI